MGKNKLINIGYNNSVNIDKVKAIVGLDSAPIKRAVVNARDNNLLIDATQGNKTLSVIFLNDGYLILSNFSKENLANKLNKGADDFGSEN